MDRFAHWNEVYKTKLDTEVSWYQDEPRMSLALIHSVAEPGARIIDVGGGTSLLVDKLLDAGYDSITVLDISQEALDRAAVRLGSKASAVRWISADITAPGELGTFDVWHDRAVFHFLTDSGDRKKYAELARKSLPEGSYLIIGAFSPNGPAKCSGLDVCRYDQNALAKEFEDDFELIRSEIDSHLTPGGKAQEFTFVVLRRQ